jgi:hypothetical protein
MGATFWRPVAIFGVIGLLAAVFVEAYWYPEIAALVTGTLLRQGGPGSEIVFYRDAYVRPATIAFFVAGAALILYVQRRRPEWLSRVVCATWAANLLLLVLSLLLYLRVVSAAEHYGK